MTSGWAIVAILATATSAYAGSLADEVTEAAAEPKLVTQLGPGRVTVAGFSFDLPTKGTASGDYRTGSIGFDRGWINWWPTKAFEPTRTAGTKQLTCGYRAVELGADTAKELARLVAGFACKPDREEEAVAKHGISLAPKAGWKRGLPDDELALSGPGGLYLETRRSFDRKAAFGHTVVAFAMGRLMMGRPSNARMRGDKVMFTGVIHGQTQSRPAAVLAWRCADQSIAIVSIVGEGLDDAALAFAGTARCAD